MTKLTQETEDVVERLRNASRLAQKKYVANSSELFDLAADRLEDLSDRIDVLEGALTNCFSIACDYTIDERAARSEIANQACASLRTTHRDI